MLNAALIELAAAVEMLDVKIKNVQAVLVELNALQAPEDPEEAATKSALAGVVGHDVTLTIVRSK